MKTGQGWTRSLPSSRRKDHSRRSSARRAGAEKNPLKELLFDGVHSSRVILAANDTDLFFVIYFCAKFAQSRNQMSLKQAPDLHTKRSKKT